jgi:hypothetical protein
VAHSLDKQNCVFNEQVIFIDYFSVFANPAARRGSLFGRECHGYGHERSDPSKLGFMDNCWDYNDGMSEVRMGQALRGGYRRSPKGSGGQQ